MTDIPYLMRGVMPVGTESSMLVSSSKYLNHPRLREWVAMILLRKNGPDFPAQAEMYPLIGILDELRDHDRIEALFTEERKTNTLLDDCTLVSGDRTRRRAPCARPILGAP